ncbi:hypothetical protein SVAN01_06429 [Stagonosporopsis vannaccii]|nr:hypothetical protein SVAN01_06429 [Stagonosporopsis vannaccii]
MAYFQRHRGAPAIRAPLLSAALSTLNNEQHGHHSATCGSLRHRRGGRSAHSTAGKREHVFIKLGCTTVWHCFLLRRLSGKPGAEANHGSGLPCIGAVGPSPYPRVPDVNHIPPPRHRAGFWAPRCLRPGNGASYVRQSATPRGSLASEGAVEGPTPCRRRSHPMA